MPAIAKVGLLSLSTPLLSPRHPISVNVNDGPGSAYSDGFNAAPEFAGPLFGLPDPRSLVSFGQTLIIGNGTQTTQFSVLATHDSIGNWNPFKPPQAPSRMSLWR